ncbi:MAG: CinA family protein [Planctomycetota bacterium]
MSETIRIIQRKLESSQSTVAAAESLTGGRVQSLLTGISGSSNFFVGGLTAYHIDSKVNLLGVDRELAQGVNGVSRETAVQMAVGVVQLFGTNFGISTTGYAEPAPGSKHPFAWIAIAKGHEIMAVEKYEVPWRSRDYSQNQVANAALELFANCFNVADN